MKHWLAEFPCDLSNSFSTHIQIYSDFSKFCLNFQICFKRMSIAKKRDFFYMLTCLFVVFFFFFRWWQLPYYWVGIKMYDLVAGTQCLKSSYVLSKSRALELFPMLRKDKLVGAIVYYDGMSSPFLPVLKAEALIPVVNLSSFYHCSYIAEVLYGPWVHTFLPLYTFASPCKFKYQLLFFTCCTV